MFSLNSFLRPSHRVTNVLLEQFPAAQEGAEKASLLVKARRFAVATASNTLAPSCLEGRVARGQPLPRVTLLSAASGNKKANAKGKLCKLVAFVLGMNGGPGNAGMPWDIFGVVLDLLMPTWDPLRRKGALTGPLLQG